MKSFRQTFETFKEHYNCNPNFQWWQHYENQKIKFTKLNDNFRQMKYYQKLFFLIYSRIVNSTQEKGITNSGENKSISFFCQQRAIWYWRVNNNHKSSSTTYLLVWKKSNWSFYKLEVVFNILLLLLLLLLFMLMICIFSKYIYTKTFVLWYTFEKS